MFLFYTFASESWGGSSLLVCFFTEYPGQFVELQCPTAVQIITINFCCFYYTGEVLALKPTNNLTV